MRITIEYESSWKNSFLNGSNNETIPKRGREFIGSMTKLKERNPDGKRTNFIHREITHDTIMGILNRLIGDQRKLYQSRQCSDYFFSKIESCIRHENLQDRSVINDEIIFIRNMTGSTDQNSFTGAIKGNDPIFTSEYSDELWGVLNLDFDGLCQFILQPNMRLEDTIRFEPLLTLDKLEHLNTLKAVEANGLSAEALMVLQSQFPEAEYVSKGMIRPIMFYCSALYLQIERLRLRYDFSGALTKGGGLPGISKRGFTGKDFMDRFTTGDKKRIWGNPFLLKEKIKGVGEATSMLTKASGVLEILLDIPVEKATQIKEMIEAAGVSSFYLGKKGLAYVTEIRI